MSVVGEIKRVCLSPDSPQVSTSALQTVTARPRVQREQFEKNTKANENASPRTNACPSVKTQRFAPRNTSAKPLGSARRTNIVPKMNSAESLFLEENHFAHLCLRELSRKDLCLTNVVLALIVRTRAMPRFARRWMGSRSVFDQSSAWTCVRMRRSVVRGTSANR